MADSAPGPAPPPKVWPPPLRFGKLARCSRPMRLQPPTCGIRIRVKAPPFGSYFTNKLLNLCMSTLQALHLGCYVIPRMRSLVQDRKRQTEQ